MQKVPQTNRKKKVNIYINQTIRFLDGIESSTVVTEEYSGSKLWDVYIFQQSQS